VNIDLPELTPEKQADIRQAAIEMGRRKPRHRVVDKFLYALRKHPDAYRCHPEDPHKWLAACPACGESLGIAEQPWGKWQVLLFCAGGCDDPSILRALADDPGDHEHLAVLEAQDRVVLDEYARRDRARTARREIQAWQSTTTPSPNTDSTTTAPPGKPSRATASSPSGLRGRETRPPGSPPGSTRSGPPPTRSPAPSGSGSTETRP
jgi:hypothetical protein